MSEGFPRGSGIKNPLASAGDTRDMGSIPESERSSGESERERTLNTHC